MQHSRQPQECSELDTNILHELTESIFDTDKKLHGIPISIKIVHIYFINAVA